MHSALVKVMELVMVMYFFFQVRAPYKVQHPSKMSRIDTVFDCPQKEGIVPPMSSVRIPVSEYPFLRYLKMKCELISKLFCSHLYSVSYFKILVLPI